MKDSYKKGGELWTEFAAWSASSFNVIPTWPGVHISFIFQGILISKSRILAIVIESCQMLRIAFTTEREREQMVHLPAVYEDFLTAGLSFCCEYWSSIWKDALNNSWSVMWCYCERRTINGCDAAWRRIICTFPNLPASDDLKTLFLLPLGHQM